MTAASDPLPGALAAVVAPDDLLTSAEDLHVFGHDGTAALRQRPRAVVFARSAAQVAGVLAACRAAGAPVVTRGSGTGLSGGSVPTPGAVVLCLAKMDRILEVDAANQTLLAEAGAITQSICEAAEAAGLFYPPDPGSLKISTIGGNVAENSGGLRGLKYGVTRNYVMGLEVVLPDGTVCWLGNKCVKDVAGYSLKDLFIGSEGTLGVITRVLLRLVPRPKARETMLATFDTVTDAAECVSAIVAAHIIPCTLEFLDRRTIASVEAYARIGLPVEAAALLLIECDGHPAAVAEEMAAVETIVRRHRPRGVQRTADPAEAARLATARRTAFSALARIRPTTILEDVTVPRSEIPRMLACIDEVAARHRLEVATFGHFGDGNLHPTILTDERDPAEMHRVEAALGEMFAGAIALGGTITGEHGVGLAKKPYLARQLGDGTMALFRAVRRALDPGRLLNPGKIADDA